MKSIRIGNTKVLNISKLSCWPTEVPWMRSTLFEFTGICQNDQERSPDRTRMVNSSLFGSRFLTVRLGHYLRALPPMIQWFTWEPYPLMIQWFTWEPYPLMIQWLTSEPYPSWCNGLLRALPVMMQVYFRALPPHDAIVYMGALHVIHG